MFYAKPNCGLLIGNLTSQLFSNVYLNLLDQFIKRILKIKHYGRYVDSSPSVFSDSDANTRRNSDDYVSGCDSGSSKTYYSRIKHHRYGVRLIFLLKNYENFVNLLQNSKYELKSL